MKPFGRMAIGILVAGYVLPLALMIGHVLLGIGHG